MISLKSSFADCMRCELLDAPSCILETNCEDDLSKVDVIFIAENPGKEEVDRKIPCPLVGKAGQLFRKYFNKFNMHSLNFLITNTVLCLTLDEYGNTGNPTDEVIDRCKVNCFNIIRACDPKLIVLMGVSPMKAFGIGKAGITNLHGQIFKWENYDVFLTVHPSFVNRNPTVWEPKFEEDMATVAGIVRGEKIKSHKSSNVHHSETGIHRYKIPEKFYTEDYRLIDVQFLMNEKKVLYIFRDKNNKKIFHKESDEFVCYQIKEEEKAKKLVPYDKLYQVSVPYMERSKLDPEITYEGDIKITVKHAMDYYHFNKGEAKKVSSNIFFFDIEVDTGDERVFPKPEEAAFPINMITAIYNDKQVCFVVDNKTEPIEEQEGTELRIFKNEYELLREFVKFFKECNPDFIAGWNAIAFDLWYIFNRMPQIKIKQTSMSQFNEFYVDGKRYICHIPGCNAIDQDFLYRTFTFTKMENYKLGFIAQHELGETKIQLPLPFNEMYWKMLNMTIKYNIRDTTLLRGLEDKLQHINLMNELRIVCTTSFEGTTSFGQIDSIMTNYLKEKGLGSKNADPHIQKQKYPGAFVYEPNPGTYDWVVDFDFASLYPSIIITYNIGPNNFVMKTKDPHLGYEFAYHQENLPDEIDIILDPSYTKKEVKCKKDDLLKKIKDDNLIVTINGCFFKPHKDEMSVFSEVLDMLLSSRKNYKGKMFDAIQAKDKDEEFYYFTRQLVYKVLANTLYGVVANKAYRFFDLSLAGAITLGGQEALKISIVEGDAFMRHLDKGVDYKEPLEVTKKEMYSDEMPDRSRDYIVTGDTDSIFCCFEKFKGELTVKRIHGYCEKIQNFLNETKMMDVITRHNVNPEMNRLILKNELVISRGLFLAKKRYAIRVINNEGKDVDKINYMGVEIKRSDYPSKSKEFLTELSELILKSEKVSLKKLMEFVKRKEMEFIKLIKAGDKSIARPVAFGKDIKDYKTVPQGVRAMMAWNEIMYDIHKPGAKGYLYRVQGIDQLTAPEDVLKKYELYMQRGNKLDVIAVPDEEEKLPEYIIPDLKANLKFCFEDRYELMLKPLLEAKKQMEVMTI